MTLTITIVTPRVAYQSADYRLVEAQSNRPVDFKTQKAILVNMSGWTALVAFAGVGRTARVDVSEWLADKVSGLALDSPIDQLMDSLLAADHEWLGHVTDPVRRRHSFSVAGFVGSQSVLGLVSNFEDLAGREEPLARPKLESWLVDVKGRPCLSLVNGGRCPGRSDVVCYVSQRRTLIRRSSTRRSLA